jgi:hypothetical protein
MIERGEAVFDAIGRRKESKDLVAAPHLANLPDGLLAHGERRQQKLDQERSIGMLEVPPVFLESQAPHDRLELFSAHGGEENKIEVERLMPISSIDRNAGSSGKDDLDPLRPATIANDGRQTGE